MASVFSPLLALFLLFNLHVSADIVFEDGYTVSTVLDGHKLNINPHSILPQFGSSDLVILDSSDSSFFTVSFTASQDSAIKRLSGNGYGFSDGDLVTAKFNKPKSFAVDLNGNIYVADRGNRAIRKISKSGVNTIAGGSKTQGKADGSGRNASFSDDFELAFIPETCALIICDHGNQLVRQINLKSQDCARGSQSELGVSAWALALGLGVSCLLGLIIGFAVRPYITFHEGSNPLRFNQTRKHYLISRGRQVPTFCFDIRNAVVSSTVYTVSRRFIMLSLSSLSLMFRINTVESRILHEKPASLLDSELSVTKEITKSKMFVEQLKDLINLDGEVELPDPAEKIFEEGDCHECRNDIFSEGHQRIDNMIQASIMGFEQQAKKAPLEEPWVISSGLVKRK